MAAKLNAADQRLLAFLVRSGRVERQQAEAIEQSSDTVGRSLVEILQKSGMLSEEDLARTISEGLRLPLLKLDIARLHDGGADLVKESLATRYGVVPLRADDDYLTLAMSNPFDQEAIRQVAFASACRIRPAVAPRSEILRAIPVVYGRSGALGTMLADISAPGDLELVSAKVRPAREIDVRELSHQASEAPIIKLVNLMLVDALNAKASDIHVEPGPNLVLVRYRVHGILENALQIPKRLQNPIVARVKVMSGADITERRTPQDGHFGLRYDGRLVDVRVSTLPTSDGEKIVMRVLDPTLGPRRLDDIGLSDSDLRRIRKLIHKPQGMILVTGPTGSGKTTTLYSILQEVASPEVNVVTIENPIEYELKGVSQVDVNDRQGLTFATTLRSVLRQDPDVILVGEIRDRETAEVAAQAAQTGHLVLSTVHTNDTAATVTRLLDLGLEPYVIASSLVGVVAQRLVRTVCEACAEPVPPDAEAGREIGLRDRSRLRRGKGCPACRKTGFSGRVGCYEIMEVTTAVQQLIETRAPESALRLLAEEEGMTTLHDDAIGKIEAGRTTSDEALRVIQLDSRGPQCPSCSNAVDAAFTVCPHCRVQLRLICGACGVTLKKSWVSCPYCGAATRPPADPEAGEPEAAGRAPLLALHDAGSGDGAGGNGNGHAEPRTPAGRARPHRALRSTKAGSIRRPRVLVVDDEPDARRLVGAVVERAPIAAEVVEAASGAEALALVENDRPHLIILDLRMPEMDGYEVCKRLRSNFKTALIPILILTALEDAESKSLGFLAGTDDYVVKPFRPDEIASRVGWLLERSYRLAAAATPSGTEGEPHKAARRRARSQREVG
jgi:type IV pilus assembly protein PilB